MPLTVTQYLNIKQKAFDKLGAFDAVLDCDARLFVDPFLLPTTSAPELKDGRDVFLSHFSKVLTLLASSQSKNDRTWIEAEKLLTFREVKGFNLGYRGEGSYGSGMGPTLRKELMQTAHEIVKKGIQDPIIFELVNLFHGKIGCDRISDMVCNILYGRFLDYSSRIFTACGVKVPLQKIGDRTLLIPENPFRKEPIILVPKDILQNLPVADNWSEIGLICGTNQVVRQKLSRLVGDDWLALAKKKEEKERVRKFLIEQPEFLKDIIAEYKKVQPLKYDFEEDPSGEANWARIAQEFTSAQSLDLTLSKKAKIHDLESVINKVCAKFRDLIEQNGMWRFLYKENMKPKHESAAQLIFYAVSSIYCEANNLSVARESNAGRGPVDFKLANGNANVVVEIKLSTNPYLMHAYEEQVPIYEKSENSFDSIIVVILVKEKSKPLDNLLQRKSADQRQKKKTPHILLVDGTPKKSASKA